MTVKELRERIHSTETTPIVVRDDVGNLYDLHDVLEEFGLLILQVHLTDLGAANG